MTVRVFVPADSSALAVGAGEVALAIAAQAAARGSAIELVRNGSRGLSWLEPLVEVATPAGRVAYGPVTVADVRGLLDAGFLAGADHRREGGEIGQGKGQNLVEKLGGARV